MYVSPQYHLVFDDEFMTVTLLASEEVPPKGEELVFKSESVTTTDYDLVEIWICIHEDATKPVLNQEGEICNNSDKTVSFKVNQKLTAPSPVQSELFLRSPEGDQVNENTSLVSEEGNPEGDKNLNILLQPTSPNLNELSRRKLNQTPKQTLKVLESTDKSVQTMFGLATIIFQDKQKPFITRLVYYAKNISSLLNNTINNIPYFCLNTDVSSNDTFILTKMLKQENIGEFVKAMVKVVADHEDCEHCEMFLRSDMPEGAKNYFSNLEFQKEKASRWTRAKTQS